jgi:hypothetical protein
MKLATVPFLTALLGAALLGCGSDDDAASNVASNDTPSIVDAAPLRISARDYAYDGVPATIASGTPIALTNSSTREAHELTAFRLPEGEARPVKELVALPPEELGALLLGAPTLALVAEPSANGEVVLGDGALHEPGRYLFVCFIPVGAKPDEVLAAMQKAAADPSAGPPQIEGGPPHMTAGMIAEVEVVS